jgi:hypothetical protein
LLFRKAAGVTDAISYTWRGPVTDDEMVDLFESHGGNGQWAARRLRQRRLGRRRRVSRVFVSIKKIRLA